jgi:hypothetical protein
MKLPITTLLHNLAYDTKSEPLYFTSTQFSMLDCGETMFMPWMWLHGKKKESFLFGGFKSTMCEIVDFYKWFSYISVFIKLMLLVIATM